MDQSPANSPVSPPCGFASLSRGQRRAALVAVIALALAGVWTLQLFLPSLGWAVILAVSLWPVYSRFCRLWPSQSRALLPGIATLLILLAIILPLILIAVAIAQDSAAFSTWLAQAAATGIAPPPMLSNLPWGDHLTRLWQDNLNHPGAINELAVLRGEAMLQLGTGGRFIGAVVHRMLLVFFTLLILFFLLRDGETTADGLRRASTRAFGPAGERVGEQMALAVRGTVNGLVVVGLGEGVILGIAYFAAGAPHPALMGLLTGLLSAIPFGAVLAYCAAAALLAANGQVGAAVGIFVLGSVLVFIADHFIRPALIGGTTRLPFLWVLLGILGGIEAWGLIGLVLGPAVMAALVLLWREWIGEQEGPLNLPVEPAP